MSEVKKPEDFNLFNQMCHEILVASKHHEAYTKLLHDYLQREVFVFGRDTHFSAGNEGRNAFIRAMIKGASLFMNEKLKDGQVKNVKRTRKDVLNND